MSRVVVLLFAVSLCCLACADDPASIPKTVLTQPGKLLFQDDFARLQEKDWPPAKGKWEIVQGVLKVTQLKEDNHAAVRRHPLPFRSAVIAYDFKLDGAKLTTLSINGPGGHVCRVRIDGKGFSVNKDKDKKKDLPGAVLDTCKVEIQPGVWHTLVVEFQGQEMVACLDGKHYAVGAHPGIDVPKTSVGLTVGGDSVSFRNFRVWEATPNPAWAATKAKLVRQ